MFEAGLVVKIIAFLTSSTHKTLHSCYYYKLYCDIGVYEVVSTDMILLSRKERVLSV